MVLKLGLKLGTKSNIFCAEAAMDFIPLRRVMKASSISAGILLLEIRSYAFSDDLQLFPETLRDLKKKPFHRERNHRTGQNRPSATSSSHSDTRRTARKQIQRSPRDNTELNMPLLATTTTTLTTPALIQHWFTCVSGLFSAGLQSVSSPKLWLCVKLCLTAIMIGSGILHLDELFSSGFTWICLTSAVHLIGSGGKSLILEISEYQRLTKAHQQVEI